MNRSRSAAGYTLVEVLIALALSVVLLTCVYGSLRVYWQLTDAGRTQVEQAQLARALVRRLEVDLASLVFVEPDNTDTSSGQAADSSSSSSGGGSSTGGSSSSRGSSSGTNQGSSGGSGSGTPSSSGSGSTGGTTGSQSSSSSGQTQVTTSTTSFAGTSVGLKGDSSQLMLHITRPARDLDYSAIGGGGSLADRLSDLQSVSYFLAAPGAGGLAGAVGDRVNDRANPQKVSGLARLEGDQMSIDFADAQSNVATLAEAAEIIAPEVAALQFRYFDGSAWYDSWDSLETARLPMAIEMTMGFQLPEDNTPDARSRRRSTEPQIGRTIRQVIAVPMAVPYVPGVTD